MLVYTTVVLIGGSILLAAAGGIPGSSPQVDDSVPFDLHRNFVVAVRGRLADRLAAVIVLDTGTSTTLVDTRLAGRLGLTGKAVELSSFSGTESAEEVIVPSLTVGPFRAAGFRALVADLSRLDDRFGLTPDVILGSEALKGSCFSIDYANRTLHFGRRGGWQSHVALRSTAGFLVVEALIEGHRFALLADTGSAAIVLFESAVPPRWRTRSATTLEAEDFTGSLLLRQFTVASVELGKTRWGSGPIFISPPVDRPYDGVLGPRALGIGRLQFDLERMTMSWSQ
jgi:hypothetical protein